MEERKKTTNLDQMKCVKDKKDKVLVYEKDIKDRGKTYFYNLFNEEYYIPKL